VRTLARLRAWRLYQVPGLLAAWSYPRELLPGELAVSSWFAFGDDVLVWLNSYEGEPHGEAMMHVAAAPDVRGRWFARYGLDMLYAESRKIGLVRLVTDPPRPRLARGLVHLGWTQHEDGTLSRELVIRSCEREVPRDT